MHSHPDSRTHGQAMKWGVIAALALGSGYSALGQCPPTGSTYNHSKFLTPNYRIRWSICSTTLAMRIEATGTGWIGIGFNNSASNGHSSADDIMGKVVAGVATLNDCFTSNHSAPIVDAIQNVTLVSGNEGAGVTVIDFTRPLNTGDAANDFILTAGAHPIHWAIGPNDTTTVQHGTMGTVSLDLFGPATCLSDVNADNAVNVNDLLAVITNWGAIGLNPSDINDDLSVNVNDLLAVITSWGACP